MKTIKELDITTLMVLEHFLDESCGWELVFNKKEADEMKKDLPFLCYKTTKDQTRITLDKPIPKEVRKAYYQFRLAELNTEVAEVVAKINAID